MNAIKNIKRFWLWVGILLFIELAAFTLWKRWYWFFPTHTVSELYTRYAGTEGINAAFVKDYRVNDTVSVDATLLQATTDNGWDTLYNRFFGKKLSPDALHALESLKTAIGELQTNETKRDTPK